MKKILLTTYSFTDGGGTKRVKLIRQILEDNGFQATVVSFNAVMQGQKYSLRTVIQFFFYLSRLIRKENYSILVCCNSRNLFPICKAVSWTSNVRYVSLVQIIFKNQPLFFKYFYSDTIISVSKGVADYLVRKQGLKKESITLIRNSSPGLEPISEKRIQQLKNEYALENDFVISCIARYDPVKGHKYLLEAFTALLQQYPNTKLILMGYGDYIKKIRQYIDELGIGDKVLFIQSDQPVNEIMMVSDVLILPSLREGLPTMIIEAFSLGKTVIASDIPGTDEILEHNYNGLSFPVKDAQSLQACITKLIGDRDFKKELEKNALTTYKKQYDFQDYKDKIVDFFKAI